VLFRAGDYPFHSHAIVSGTVRIIDVSSGERAVMLRYGEGYFTGDLDLLTHRPSVLGCEADTDLEVIRLSLRQLRTMFTQNPRLGDKFWKSFQRRRDLLRRSSFRGLTVSAQRITKARSRPSSCCSATRFPTNGSTYRYPRTETSSSRSPHPCARSH
jgi:CRP-like cAMP-binding protein